MATHIHFHPSDGINFSITGPKGPVGPRGPRGFPGPQGNVGPLTNTLTSYQNIFITGNYNYDYLYSTNASNWKTLYLDNYTDSNLYNTNSIAYGSNLWVAVGGNYFSDSPIKVSRDGYTWTSSSNGSFSGGNYYNAGNGVAYGSSMWVAVGNGDNTIQVSRDGYNWEPSSNGGFSDKGNGIAYGSNAVGSSLWVAVGTADSSRSSIQVSTDGYNWSNSLSGGFLNGCYSVAYGSNKWVAVGKPSFETGQSSIQVSTDGYNWHVSSTNLGFYTAGRSVAYGSNALTGSSLWVAVGNDDGDPKTIQLSSDGYHWFSSFNGGFSYSGLGITYGSNLWVAVGDQDYSSSTIQVSQDGSNWNIIQGTSNSPLCIAYGRSKIATKVEVGSVEANTLNDIPLADLEVMYQQWLSRGGKFIP